MGRPPAILALLVAVCVLVTATAPCPPAEPPIGHASTASAGHPGDPSTHASVRHASHPAPASHDLHDAHDPHASHHAHDGHDRHDAHASHDPHASHGEHVDASPAHGHASRAAPPGTQRAPRPPEEPLALTRPCPCGCEKDASPGTTASRLGFALARADDARLASRGSPPLPPAALPRLPDAPDLGVDPIPI